MSIFPYVYYMVTSFHITSDEKSVAMYAGMVTSAFAIAEFSTGVIWGRISDRFGRKPVLLTGLAGTGVSMLMFGFAPNLWVALFARAMGGLLNGNIGVINTTVAEVVTQEAHQSRAFSIMPGIWCIGSIVGAGLGGTLADPVRNYPEYFAHHGIFSQYPYLLPNLVCCAVVILSMIVGLLFLEETHEDKKDRHDIGLEVGDWLMQRLRRPVIFDEKKRMFEEEYGLLGDSDSRSSCDYSSMDSSPALLPLTIGTADLSSGGPAALEAGTLQSNNVKMSGTFTNQVVMIIVSYGLLAFHTISAEQLLPVLLSMPHTTESPRLPFFFTGGFELPTKIIGSILSMQGIIQTIATLVVFPFVSQKLGSLTTFRLSVLSYPFLYLLVPYLTVMPENLQRPLLYVVIVWKVTAQAFAFPPLQILLANSAPSKKVLGTLNGSAASSASLCRAIGPTLSGLIQSAGLSIGCLGLPWWSSSAVAVVAAVLSLALTDKRRTSASPATLETDQNIQASPPVVDEFKDMDVEVRPLSPAN
ncbi:MFS-type transporter-like protein 26 [Elsinoe fawcettii]|nr:MFS-type transporter-like protein 26 [Elsinoe fawcettii]